MTEPSRDSMRILVTGGAGYIGSHAVRSLRAEGHAVEVVDHLQSGHRDALPEDVALHEIDIRDSAALEQILGAGNFDAVMHFAAWISVAESIVEPDRYMENNLGGTESLVRALAATGVRRVVFSSTAAVYGVPASIPIDENFPIAPVHPYGESKAAAERTLSEWVVADRDRSLAILRYFNVAGAADDGSLGEDHHPETHLVPNVLHAALDNSAPLQIFGDDYPTPDGTCIRDYIHVEDLVDAHAFVLTNLARGDRRVYNLGIGRGFSVRQILQAAETVTGRTIPVRFAPRRAGDVPELRSDPGLIYRELGWRARHSEVHPILESAWRWLCKHPAGYDTSVD